MFDCLIDEIADLKSKTPFTEAGDCLDEVEFVFDDGQKLYVSQNFLHYVSPVFKAMFLSDFKEKETRNVTLKEKIYEDFLEFLLCLHPDVQKPVDSGNVLSVVPLNEEYQAKLLIRKCKDAMSKWLQSELESAREASSVLQKLKQARACLRILSTVETLQYNEMVEKACKIIGNFGHAIFTGTVSQTQAYTDKWRRRASYKSSNEDPLADCKSLFDKLPEQLKYQLMVARLTLRDNLEMFKPS